MLTAESTGTAALLSGSGGLPGVVVGVVGEVKNIVSGIFSGSARDAARQARVNDFLTAAKAGSVIAGRIILGGPGNVAGDEKPMWTAAWSQLQAANPTVAAAAFAQGAMWHPNDDAASDGLWAPVLAELQQIGNPVFTTNPETASPIDGSTLPGRAGPSSGPSGIVGQVRTDLGSLVQQAGSQAVNSVANGIAGSSQPFVTLPTTKSALLLWGLVLGGVGYLLLHHRD